MFTVNSSASNTDLETISLYSEGALSVTIKGSPIRAHTFATFSEPSLIGKLFGRARGTGMPPPRTTPQKTVRKSLSFSICKTTLSSGSKPFNLRPVKTFDASSSRFLYDSFVSVPSASTKITPLSGPTTMEFLRSSGSVLAK